MAGVARNSVCEAKRRRRQKSGNTEGNGIMERRDGQTVAILMCVFER